MMERLSPYISYEREPLAENLHHFEQGFESYTRILKDELETLHFSPVEEKFKRSVDEAPRSSEVLWHNETQTLVIPSPTDDDLTAADLANMAVPVTGFIKQTQPDIVVGCDRGGRLYSIAVYSLWGDRNPKKRFPTLDGKLHFARLSTSVDPEAIDRSLTRVIRQSTKQAKMSGKLRNGDRTRILFIDDWILSGATREHINASLERLGLIDKIDVNFAVMCGGNADTSGGQSTKNVPWQDNPRLIGIDYERKSNKPYPVHTKAVRKIRQDIHLETKKIAKELRSKRISKHLTKVFRGVEATN